MIKATHGIFNNTLKHSQLFETNHATAINTKHMMKITTSMISKSLALSQNMPFFALLQA
jgi:hypothetical protein